MRRLKFNFHKHRNHNILDYVISVNLKSTNISEPGRFLKARLAGLTELRRWLRSIEGILALWNMSLSCFLGKLSHAIRTRHSSVEGLGCGGHLLLDLINSSLCNIALLATSCLLCCFHSSCHLNSLLELGVLCPPLWLSTLLLLLTKRSHSFSLFWHLLHR